MTYTTLAVITARDDDGEPITLAVDTLEHAYPADNAVRLRTTGSRTLTEIALTAGEARHLAAALEAAGATALRSPGTAAR